MNVSEYITENERLPHADLEAAWESIVAADEVKDRLINQALLALRLRARAAVRHDVAAWAHPPLRPARAPARPRSRAAWRRSGAAGRGGKVRLIEINPHGLMSAEHGQSQQRVFELLCEHIPLLADDGMPTVVVLDEVESMAVARSAASLSANPADVHRATDAVLMALDRNAREHPHLVTVATSNFTAALDEAFRSRADVAHRGAAARRAGALAILQRTLTDFAGGTRSSVLLAQDPHLDAWPPRLVGLDGRRIRKVVTEALAGQSRDGARPEQATDRRPAGGGAPTEGRRGNGRLQPCSGVGKSPPRPSAAPPRHGRSSRELVGDTLERSSSHRARRRRDALDAARRRRPHADRGRPSQEASPGAGRRRAVAGDHTPSPASAALTLEENLNPVPGAAGASDWTLHVPQVEPMAKMVRDRRQGPVRHLSADEPGPASPYSTRPRPAAVSTSTRSRAGREGA